MMCRRGRAVCVVFFRFVVFLFPVALLEAFQTRGWVVWVGSGDVLGSDKPGICVNPYLFAALFLYRSWNSDSRHPSRLV